MDTNTPKRRVPLHEAVTYAGRSRYWFHLRFQTGVLTRHRTNFDQRLTMVDLDELDTYLAAAPAPRPRVEPTAVDTPAPEPARGP